MSRDLPDDDVTEATPAQDEQAHSAVIARDELTADVRPFTAQHVPSSGPATGETHHVGGRYEILALLGVGGMGRVYRARDLELDEIIAMKVLQLPLESALDRFRREVKLARRVTHRNVARTYDLGEHEGTRYLTMELIEGPSLAEIVSNEGPQSAQRVAGWAREICLGLSAAHAAGVIHRDLKPQNVLLERATGRVVLTDFGIARALVGTTTDEGSTLAGQVVGTPAYMAPEQLAGRDDLDARVDVWALGATMFRLLTGHGVRGVSARESGAPMVPEGYQSDPRVVRSDVPVPIARIVQRCLAAERDARYASAAEVADDLARIGSGEDSTSVARAPNAARRETSLDVARTSEIAMRRVAVLPFDNDGDTEDAHFALGLAEELTDALSMMPGLRVSALGAVRAKRPADRDPREVGRELAVDVVVTGSVRRRGDRVRVVVRLVGVADGFQLWTRRIDGGVGDLLRIGAEAAEALGVALATRCSTVVATVGAARTTDPVAIDLFFRGRQAYRQFWAEDAGRAVSLFESALERAPDDPVILAAYAMACARRGFHGHEEGQLARRAAKRALAAAPHLAEAHVAEAHVLCGENQPEQAAAELARAIELSPLSADARESLGRLLVEAGATRLGCGMLQTALCLDPDNDNPHVLLGRTHALLGEWDAATTAFASVRSSAMVPLGWLMETRVALWRRDASVVESLRARAQPNDDAMAVAHGYLALLEGDWLPVEAQRFLDALLNATPHADPRRRVLARQVRAEAAAFVGDTPTAIEQIVRASDEGLYDALWLERCPLLDDLRDAEALARARGVVLGRARRVIDQAQGPLGVSRW